MFRSSFERKKKFHLSPAFAQNLTSHTQKKTALSLSLPFLVSPAMLTDHLIEATVQEAIAHSIIFHPNNPSDPEELAKQRALAARMEKLVRVFFFFFFF